VNEIVIKIGFSIVGLINLLPVMGVISNSRLTALYGIEVATTDLSLLLRHRAVMLGVIGSLLIVCAWKKNLRVAAAISAMVSMLSYIALAFNLEVVNEQLLRTAWVDTGAVVVLLGIIMFSIVSTLNLRV
jgi:hypothetical protein